MPKEVRIIIVEQMVKHASTTKTIRYLETNKNQEFFKLSQIVFTKLQELKSTAKDTIRNVNENMLTAVIANFCKSVGRCLLFKKKRAILKML